MNKSILSILAVLVLMLAIWRGPSASSGPDIGAICQPLTAAPDQAYPGGLETLQSTSDSTGTPARTGGQGASVRLPDPAPELARVPAEGPADLLALVPDVSGGDSLQPPSDGNIAAAVSGPVGASSAGQIPPSAIPAPAGREGSAPGTAPEPANIRNPFFRAAPPLSTIADPSSDLPVLAQNEETADPAPPRLLTPPPVTSPAPGPQYATTGAMPSRRPVACPPAELARARQRIEYGNALGRRGATASAQAEFLAALSVVTEGRDSVSSEGGHSARLQRAMTVLRELGDFYRDNAGYNAIQSTASIVDQHSCGLIAHADAVTMSRPEATAIYCAEIRRLLVDACGLCPASSDALVGMGKIQSMQSGSPALTADYAANVACVLFSAALDCNPANSKCANELGVCLARRGEFAAARELFLRSLRGTPTVAGWQNLAKTHERLGEYELAGVAAYEGKLLADNGATLDSGAPAEWADPRAFSGSPETVEPMLEPSARTAPPADQPVAREASRGTGWPNPFRQAP